MIAVEIVDAGPAGRLVPAELPRPVPGPGEVLIRVAAAGLNRGDLMQRIGRYPPPPGASPIPGLEVAGTIAALGPDTTGFAVGDRVCALLAGGGYAEYAAAPALQCLPLPASVSMIEGAALPEALFTCWTNMVEDGHMQAGSRVLVHGGASGIGTAAIQLARVLGATVYVTAGTPEKCAACEALGAARAINYRAEDFVAAIQAATAGQGVDLVLDMVGADYVERSLEVLAPFGRYVIIGVMKTPDATISVTHLIAKRVSLTGSTLRSRSPAEKGRIRDALAAQVWPAVAARELVGVIDRTFPLERATEAQERLESGAHTGKVILTTAHLDD